jgi:hypothetical protein
MGTRLIFRGLAEVTNSKVGTSLSDWACRGGVPGNSPANKTVPQTDTGGQVEHTQALERMVLKELGKLPS